MKKIFTILAVVITHFIYAQNVGINSTGVAANPSASLDIDAAPANNTGLLIPRIPLVATNNASPVTSPATSLLVYNTATAGTSPTNVTPGYYYWDGTKWVRMQTTAIAAQDWSLLGNLGTTAGTNFLGTTDAQDLVFKTNNNENMRVLNSNGSVGIGIASTSAALHVVSPSALTAARIAQFERTGAVGSFFLSSGASAGDWNGLTVAGDKSIIFTNDNDPVNDAPTGLVIGPWTAVGNANQFKGLKIMENGKVGIGTAAPAAQLDVTSTTQGFAMPRMTTAQRLAIVSPVDGLQVFDINLKDYYYSYGGVWDCVSMRAGTVSYFANITAPRGYLECNGQSVSTTTYPELFNAIGYTYGGSGATFNVPDLRGEFIRGADDGRGADPGRAMGTWQSPSPVVHDDTNGAAAQDANFSMDHVAASFCDNWPGTLAGGIPNAYWSAFTSTWNVYTGTATGGSAYGMISASRPRNIALMPCIKF